MIDRFRGEYRWLSNFWMVEVEYEGIVYSSTEHAYQATKTLDKDIRKKISRMEKPGESKKFGKTLTLREDWEDVRLQVMLDLTRLKFQDPELQEKLLATGDQPLVEGNEHGDSFWGVYRGHGENHLGKTLMRVREEIRNARPLQE